MTHGLVPVSTIVFAVSLVLAGCGGGGGGVRPAAPAPGGSQPPPPMIKPTCVQTADLGCLSP